MERLPIEVQLLYLEYLNVVDIIHLQQTCRRIFNLIEHFAEVIWRHCLRRQCHQNGLLWASFSDLSTASDLRNACTTIPRFHQAYRRAVINASGAGPKTISSAKQSLSVSRPEILDYYTVPGGRFLLSFEPTQLSLWDVNSLKVGSNFPALCTIQKETNEAVIFVNVASARKLHILLRTETVEIGSHNSKGEEWSTSFKLLELINEGHDRNPQLVLRRVGCLKVIHPENDGPAIYSFANCQGKLALHSVKGATVIWDPTHSRCAASGWRLDGVADIMEIFCNDDSMMYLNADGIHAIKIPDLQPIRNGRITFSSFKATRLAPTFSLPYSRSHSFATTAGFHSGNVVFPAICQPNRPLVFMVKENLSKEMVHGYWYQFDFDRIRPEDSTLKVVGSFQLPTPHINSFNLMAYPYHLCGDLAAVLWVDENDDELDSLLFSLSSPTQGSTEVLPSNLSATSEPESTPLSPDGEWELDSGATTCTSTLDLVHIMHGPASDIKPTFCPAAAQAAILWASDVSEADDPRATHSIDMYHFVH